MPLEIAMPKLSDTMTEGDLVAWLVPEGAVVRAGEPIAEIETDKSTVELEAPESGTLARFLVRDGTQGIAVGRALAVLVREGEASEAPEPVVARTAPEAPAVALAPRVSPLAERMAAHAALDLARVAGSGAGGRVLRVDVERALGRAARAPEVARSRAQRTAADRLTASKRDVPHFYLWAECDLGALAELRAMLARRDDPRRYSWNDFALRAAALALRDVPEANASFGDGVLRRHEEIDVAVAVASDAGLVAPIVRGADRLRLSELHDAVRALTEKARSGRLEPREYTGGTFTVSNLGTHGVDGLHAIVNPPQVAILGVGRVRARALVREGALVAGESVVLSLSADHRVVDGALGARLLGAVRARLEDPLALLL